eukprot:4956642-Alexandrium_andersonii.AAC.1
MLGLVLAFLPELPSPHVGLQVVLGSRSRERQGEASWGFVDSSAPVATEQRARAAAQGAQAQTSAVPVAVEADP